MGELADLNSRTRTGTADIDFSATDRKTKRLIELEDLRYVDDRRYAVRFATDRRHLDSWGDGRIERRLRELGVDRSLIAEALAARGEAPTELEAAVTLLRRRFPQPPETPRDRDRAIGMLARKGYDLELAYDAVRALGRL